MSSRYRMIALFILVLGCLGSQNILARTIYQWTDEEGNINFSDVPPSESMTTETREISINLRDPDNVDFEKYSIINQLEQMAAWRRQLAEERLAEKMLYLEEKRLAHEIELQLEISKRNEAITADEYASRSYYYAPYRPLHHRRHGINRHQHQIQQQPASTPSRRNRNIIQRKYGPVHL